MTAEETTAEHSARLCEQAAAELERAARHCAVAAAHFRDRAVPRGAAHAWAAHGHLERASRSLAEQAELHAQHSNA